jgi:hypothetical protein
MRRPVNGSSLGSVSFSRRSERRILRGGICACLQAVRRAQQHHVLEAEAQLRALAARRRHEPGFDERGDDAARQPSIDWMPRRV